MSLRTGDHLEEDAGAGRNCIKKRTRNWQFGIVLGFRGYKLYKGCGKTRVVAWFVILFFFKPGDHRGKRAQTGPVPLQLFTGTPGPDVLFPGLGMSALDLQELSKCLLGQALPIKQNTGRRVPS